MMEKYYGKYRGVVSNNVDPLQKGRLLVQVPDVLGQNISSWALPCVPYAGKGVGFFAVPPVGANVWIEFESGNPGDPIWTGCFWDEGDVPADPALAQKKVLKTDAGAITLDDTPGAGGITIETSDGMKMVMNRQGIEITTGQGKIKLTGNQVSINDGALEVT
jgi:uncharacterized protein involved in type VI secretion and phage assembly